MVAFSIIIPTCGRPTLERTLRSIILAGATRSDEVLVIGDGPQPAARRIVACFVSRLRITYLETAPSRCSGNAQRNHAFDLAKGSHLIAIDDDDAYRPGAFSIVRAAAEANPGRFLIFRMESHTPRHPWGTLWNYKGASLGNVGTPMMVAPNVLEKLGRWGDRYCGDFDFLESTLAHYPEGPVWLEDVIVDVY